MSDETTAVGTAGVDEITAEVTMRFDGIAAEGTAGSDETTTVWLSR